MISAALVLALVGGVGLGVLFFGGLRLTVDRLVTARRPALLALGSFGIRTAVVVAGFALVGQGHWERYIAALCGFLIARVVLVRLWGPAAHVTAMTKGGGDDGH